MKSYKLDTFLSRAKLGAQRGLFFVASIFDFTFCGTLKNKSNQQTPKSPSPFFSMPKNWKVLYPRQL